MTLDELIAKIDATVVTPEMVAAMEERLNKADKEFAEDRKRREGNPQEYLNRQFTI